MKVNTLRNKLIQRSYHFSLEIIRLLDSIQIKNISFYIISKQLIRSATSVCANITEAQASPTQKDFTNFLSHALKSANESRYWLSLLRDTTKIKSEKIIVLLKEIQEISRILGASIRTLKQKP